MSTLEDLLKAGADALEFARKAEADKIAANLAYNQEFDRLELESAKLLIPEALREFATISGENSYKALVITLPGGPAVQHTINIMTTGDDWEHPVFRLVELADNRRARQAWTAFKWQVSDGDVTYWPTVPCASLETALALAVELYDGREEVENTAKRLRKQMEAREEKSAQKPVYMHGFCPLTKDDCMGDTCAWWVTERNACTMWCVSNNVPTL